MPSRDINVIALVKGGERYVFLYDDDSRAEAISVLGKFAANPELSFSWYDAGGQGPPEFPSLAPGPFRSSGRSRGITPTREVDDGCS
jgi:hypothetical protein